MEPRTAPPAWIEDPAVPLARQNRVAGRSALTVAGQRRGVGLVLSGGLIAAELGILPPRRTTLPAPGPS